MKNTTRADWAMLAALCALPGIAHALTDSEPLTMVFEASPDPVQRPNGPPVSDALRLTQACTLQIAQIEDRRSNKANAGHVLRMQPNAQATPLAVQSIRSGDPLPWVRGALQSTQRYGFRVADGAPAGGGTRQVVASTALRLAHSWSAGLNLVSHVVLDVRFRTPGGEVARQYHGMGTRANWANGNSEYMAVLNLGLEEAVRAMAVDAAALCDGKPLPAVTP